MGGEVGRSVGRVEMTKGDENEGSATKGQGKGQRETLGDGLWLGVGESGERETLSVWLVDRPVQNWLQCRAVCVVAVVPWAACGRDANAGSEEFEGVSTLWDLVWW